ncbi:hypothetical protein GCM10009077_39050 [Roseibium denhamense]
MEAGLGIIETDGVSGLSLRALAAKVGVSHTAPKNHFGSMKGLMTAIGAEGFRRFAAEMRAGLSTASSRMDKLRAAAEGYVRFAQAHPELFRIMFSPEYCDFKSEDVQSAAQDSYSVLVDISKGLDWDKADTPDAQWRTEIMLWSLVHGYATLLNSGQIDDDASGMPVPSIWEVFPEYSYRGEN